MAKMAITTPDGEQKIVREDTGKAYRGTMWALICIAAFGIITALVFFGATLFTATNGTQRDTPAAVDQNRP
ncbi:MAG TPA: hypothetical protein PKY59_26330 [Pyrinomonadaceae bacterium]|nr:hypothetical protein [Pyrinomonadaceae bacterium]